MSSKNCDCNISQLVVELFSKLLGILDHDCRSLTCHDCRSLTYSRKYLPTRSGNGKKRKCGGAGSRHRRFEARHAGTARRTSTSSPVPDRARPPARAPPSVPVRAPPDRPKPTTSLPPSPPRSASLIQDEEKRKLISKLMETSDEEEQAKLIAKLGSKLQEKLMLIPKEWPTLTKQPVHTSGPKTPPSPKSASQVWKEWNEQELAKRKSAKPKCELCPLVCICMDVGLRRKTKQHTLDSSQTTLQPKDQMLKQATRFLGKASEQMCRDAENKQKWEKVRNTPGRGFQKDQSIPNNVPFCVMCMAYKNKIHYCSAVNKYINLDVRSLVMIEGVNAEEVEGRFSNTGKCRIFETKKEMRTYLCNRVKREQEAKMIMVDSNYEHLESVNFRGLDLQFATKQVKVYKEDLEKWDKEKAIELARERPARLAKAQLEKEELEREKEKANIKKCGYSKAELAEIYSELKGVPPKILN